MAPKSADYSNYRGTIIVDANVLYHLFCEVKPEFYNPDYLKENKQRSDEARPQRIRHYLGMLDFLSKNGYHIVIPEMISAETGSVLASGTSLHDHAAIPESQRPTLHDKQLVKLLQRVARSRYPNIGIVEIMEQEHPILDAPKEYIEELYKIEKLPQGSAEAGEKLSKIRRDVAKNFGEDAILGYIADTKQRGRDDVFVLSDDRAALERIGREAEVSVMNTNGFIAAFINSKLHTTVGLRDDLKAGNILSDSAKQLSEKRGHKYYKSRWNIDQQWKKDDEGEILPVGEYKSFSTQMKKLASDLGIKSWQERIKKSDKKTERGAG